MLSLTGNQDMAYACPLTTLSRPRASILCASRIAVHRIGLYFSFKPFP